MALPLVLRHHQMLSSIEIKDLRRMQKRRGYTLKQEKSLANKRLRMILRDLLHLPLLIVLALQVKHLTTPMIYV